MREYIRQTMSGTRSSRPSGRPGAGIYFFTRLGIA
jgi:hypothetical protein